jgi:hypothetical protein
LAQSPDCESGPAGSFSFGGSRIFALPFPGKNLKQRWAKLTVRQLSDFQKVRH